MYINKAPRRISSIIFPDIRLTGLQVPRSSFLPFKKKKNNDSDIPLFPVPWDCSDCHDFLSMIEWLGKHLSKFPQDLVMHLIRTYINLILGCLKVGLHSLWKGLHSLIPCLEVLQRYDRLECCGNNDWQGSHEAKKNIWLPQLSPICSLILFIRVVALHLVFSFKVVPLYFFFFSFYFLFSSYILCIPCQVYLLLCLGFLDLIPTHPGSVLILFCRPLRKSSDIIYYTIF